MFVVVHADFTFSLLETLFDRPAEGADADHLIQGGVDGGVTEGVFDFTGGDGFSEEEPSVVSWEAIAGNDDTKSGDLFEAGAFRAFAEVDGGPSEGRKGGDHPGGDGFRLPIFQAEAGRRPATT
jgi:hypothetical protein